jgi:hypothetical protein
VTASLGVIRDETRSRFDLSLRLSRHPLTSAAEAHATRLILDRSPAARVAVERGADQSSRVADTYDFSRRVAHNRRSS